jgi:hypothetical protein
LLPREITEGLWRWTTPHPDWLPGVLDSLEDWPREVACVLFEGEDVSLFIDPLVPADAAEFWRWADARCAGRPVAVLTTLEWHARSRDAVLERYGGSAYAAGKSRDIEVLPAGVECFTVEPLGETVVWLSGPRTLVAGDVIVGSGAGSLRLCPESWLVNSPQETTLADIAVLLRPLLALPIERVLVTHGDPAFSDGHAALAAALAPVAVSSR